MKKYNFSSVLFAGLLLLSIHAHAASFQGLGGLPGGIQLIPFSISDDGSTVVGVDTSTFGQAFRWTQSTGAVSLGILPGDDSSLAFDVSADGLTIVGSSVNNLEYDAYTLVAFIWKPATGMVKMGAVSGSYYAEGISSDGSVVVGTMFGADEVVAYRWTQGGGFVALGALPGYSDSMAYGVSANGSVVVGDSSQWWCNPCYEAFRWSQNTGMVGLGILPGYDSSRAIEVSNDGSVAIGFCYYSDQETSSSGTQAFRWTQNAGMVGLGYLPGGNQSEAKSMSDDGSIVVGTSNPGATAFIWDSTKGMRPLKAELISLGLNLNGWILYDAVVSSNGRIIAGTGINPDGNFEAWIARLDAPGTNDCPADLNGDNIVNFGDLAILRANFGMTCADGTCAGDINQDGAVNFGDLAVLRSTFGNACP